MLLQVKASKQHGEWLPWLNGEIEAGRLIVKSRQVHKYMQLASNLHRGANLLEAPSIRAALELLSDKEPEAEAQGTLIDVEAERQARESAEAMAESERQARITAEQRSMVGAKLKSLFEEQAKQRQQAAGGDKKSYEASVTQEVKSVPVNLPASPDKGDSRDKAADVVGVSGKSVDFASKVIEKGTPELVQAVEQGKIAVSTAAAITQLGIVERLLEAM